jgi:hypothetical protein
MGDGSHDGGSSDRDAQRRSAGVAQRILHKLAVAVAAATSTVVRGRRAPSAAPRPDGDSGSGSDSERAGDRATPAFALPTDGYRRSTLQPIVAKAKHTAKSVRDGAVAMLRPQLVRNRAAATIQRIWLGYRGRRHARRLRQRRNEARAAASTFR